MICWQDNSEYTCSDDVKQFFPIADRPLSELMDDNGNSLLVYPHSFHDCRDGIGQLHIVDVSLSRGQFVILFQKVCLKQSAIGVMMQS